MDIYNKKFIKKASISQFQKLVEQMEMYPQLATSSPVFGSRKMSLEETWEKVAEQINVLGPPVRSALDWKKVWQDQKCRVKKEISDNNKSLHGTGGGLCNINNLTQMEQHIDRICHLSSAAAPSGAIFGVYSATNKAIQITPPRKIIKVAAVTPTTASIFSPNISNIILDHPYPSQKLNEPYSSKVSSQKILTSTPEKTNGPPQQNRKRKNLESSAERLQLVQQQTDIQRQTLQIMEKHAEAAKMQAESSKIQAEAARLNAESALNNTKMLKEISESLKVVASVLKASLHYPTSLNIFGENATLT